MAEFIELPAGCYSGITKRKVMRKECNEEQSLSAQLSHIKQLFFWFAQKEKRQGIFDFVTH